MKVLDGLTSRKMDKGSQIDPVRKEDGEKDMFEEEDETHLTSQCSYLSKVFVLTPLKLKDVFNPCPLLLSW